jgi:uncharacterized protein involved in exopolysaccharide biosynthesis
MALSGLVNLFRSESRLIMGVSLFIWAWVLAYCFVGYQPKFSSDASVIIKDSVITSQYMFSEQQAVPTKTTSSSAANPVLNTMGLLKSNAVEDSLWNFFAKKYPKELEKRNIKNKDEWKKFYETGTNIVKAKNQPGTDVIYLSFSWSNPTVAKEGLAALLAGFQQASLELNQTEQKSRSFYLKNKVAEIDKKLKDIRHQKSTFKSRNRTVSIVRESDDLARVQVELKNQLNLLRAQARGKQAEMSQYERMLGTSSAQALKGVAVGMNGSMSKLQDRLYNLEQEYAQVKTTLKDKHPHVQELKSQINEVQADMQTELQRTLGQGASMADNTMAVADRSRTKVVDLAVASKGDSIRLSAEQATINARLAEVQRDMSTLPKVEESLANLEQEEAALSQAYRGLWQKLQEANLKEAETLSNVFVFNSPSQPLNANFPTQFHLAFLGLMVAVVGGIAAAALKQQLVEGQIQYKYGADTLLGGSATAPENRLAGAGKQYGSSPVLGSVKSVSITSRDASTIRSLRGGLNSAMQPLEQTAIVDKTLQKQRTRIENSEEGSLEDYDEMSASVPTEQEKRQMVAALNSNKATQMVNVMDADGPMDGQTVTSNTTTTRTILWDILGL